MVKINKIYTRTGDDGTTGLVGGTRIEKDSLRVSAYGEVDELNSFLGRARTLAERESVKAISDKLSSLQSELFDLGSELATAAGVTWKGMLQINQRQIDRLEGWIDELSADLPELRSFVLPGGTELNSDLHIARTVCRRVERSILALSRSEEVSRLILVYFNRLSDLLFAMARYESHRAKVTEYLWIPGKN